MRAMRTLGPSLTIQLSNEIRSSDFSPTNGVWFAGSGDPVLSGCPLTGRAMGCSYYF